MAKQQEMDPKELTSLQNAAYNAAWSGLREKYRAEYDALIDAEFEKRGIKRRRRSTSEQRAERLDRERVQRAQQKLDKLLAENPELKEHLRELVS